MYDNGVERYNSSLERERITSYGYDFEIKKNEIIVTAYDVNHTQYIININSDTELEFEGTVYTKATWQDINV